MIVSDALLPFGPVGGALLLPEESRIGETNVADAADETAFAAFLKLSAAPVAQEASQTGDRLMEGWSADQAAAQSGSYPMPAGGQVLPPDGQVMPAGGRVLPSVDLAGAGEAPRQRGAASVPAAPAPWFAEGPEPEMAAEHEADDLAMLRQLGLLSGHESGRGAVRSDPASAGLAASGTDTLPGAPGVATPTASPAVPGRAALAALPMPAPGQGGFEDAMAQRLVWMATQGVQDARVRVHPEHLGPIDIRIRIEGEVAQVALSSPSSVAREALELALPRLRESLADAGLELLQAEVGGQDQRTDGRAHEDRRDGGPAAPAGDPGVEADAAPGAQPPVARVVHLLDLFA